MFVFASYLLLVGQFPNPVSSNHVLDALPKGAGAQYLAFPNEKKGESFELRIKSFSRVDSYKIVCTTYLKDKDSGRTKLTMVKIYTEEGILVEDASLYNITGSPCNEKQLSTYITIGDSTNGVLQITYLFADKKPEARCKERTYTIKRSSFMAVVERGSYPKVDCPDKVLQYYKKYDDNHLEAGGIDRVAPMDPSYEMYYIKNMLRQGKPIIKTFPETDLKGKSFSIICQEHTLRQEDPDTHTTGIITGSIFHEDFPNVVLEKLKLTACDTTYINMNRQIRTGKSRFKIVFKSAKRKYKILKCFEREYDIDGVEEFATFKSFSVSRDKLKSVRCPTKFVGDIGKNEVISKVERKLGCKNVPFQVEITELDNRRFKKCPSWCSC